MHKNPVLRASGWIVYVYAYRGGPLIGKTQFFPTKEEALKDLARIAPEIARRYAEERDGVTPGTLQSVIRAYRKSPEFGGLSKAGKAEYHRYLDKIETTLGHLDGRQLSGRVGAQAARLMRDEIAKTSLRSADYCMTILSACVSWGRKAYMLPEGAKPTQYIEKLYSPPRKDTWTDADVNKAMTSLPRHLADVVAVALHTGLRRNDLRSLTWAAVDAKRNVIRWKTSKGAKHNRTVIIPLTAPLRATLERIPRTSFFVLTNTHGKQWSASGLGHALDDALTELGIEGRLHGLRRTAATRLAAQGLSSRQIARQLGWSEAEAEAMAAIYVDEEAAAGGTQ